MTTEPNVFNQLHRATGRVLDQIEQSLSDDVTEIKQVVAYYDLANEHYNLRLPKKHIVGRNDVRLNWARQEKVEFDSCGNCDIVDTCVVYHKAMPHGHLTVRLCNECQ
jgi:hypothetical protein